MIIFELDTDDGLAREIYWLGNTTLTEDEKTEADCIYEQLTAHEVFLDD